MVDLVTRGKLTFAEKCSALTLKANTMWEVETQSQQTLCNNQVLSKTVRVVIFRVDLTWNDLIIITASILTRDVHGDEGNTVRKCMIANYHKAKANIQSISPV